MSYREEALGQTRDTLERLCLSVCLGTSLCLPGQAGGDCWGEGGLGISDYIATPDEISGIKWTDGVSCLNKKPEQIS